MADWQDMAVLVRDGRSVQFNSEAGVYTYAAIPSVVITPSQAAAFRRPFGIMPDGTYGLWPNIAFNPTLWREIS